MRKRNYVNKICVELEHGMEAFEYVRLCNWIREAYFLDIPEIHEMGEIRNMQNKCSAKFIKSDRFFVINNDNEIESEYYPDEFIDFRIIANFILENKVETDFKNIDSLIETYHKECEIIATFLEKIPKETLLEFWNDYQKEIGEEKYVYKKEKFNEIADRKYNPIELIKHIKEFNPEDDYFFVDDGEFKSSSDICTLILFDELIDFYE